MSSPNIRLSLDEDYALQNIQMLCSTVNLNILTQQTDEERFSYILQTLKQKNGLRLWAAQGIVKTSPKSSRESQKLRESGNRMSESKRLYTLNDVISQFTKSIAYAPPGSPELALAYGNRSAMQVKARLYEDALLDIERALKADCPVSSKAKLFVRRAHCLKAVNPNDTAGIQRALADAKGWLSRMRRSSASHQNVEDTVVDRATKYQPVLPPRKMWNGATYHQEISDENPKMPGASKSVAFEHSGGAEKYVVAAADIGPGEVVAVQEPYVAVIDKDRRYTNCYYCYRQTLSAIPCNTCVYAVYCSEDCRSSAWLQCHQIECQTLDRMISVDLDVHNLLSMRAVIQALKKAGSFEALKEKISEIESDPAMVDDGDDFANFHTLPTFLDKRTPIELLEASYKTLITVFLLATRTEFFGKELSFQEFLQHEWVPFVGGLIMRYCLISWASAVCGMELRSNDDKHRLNTSIMPLKMRFTQSCAPNTSSCCFGKKVLIFACYPIKKGEKITSNRASPFEITAKPERQAELIRQIGSPCECIVCREDWPMIDPRLFTIPSLIAWLSIALRPQRNGGFSITEMHPFVLAKLIIEAATATVQYWGSTGLPSDELYCLSTILLRIFTIMGNHYDLL